MENNFQFTSAAVSDKGLSDKRPQNEDSYLELKNSGLFAVADGVGGAQAGDVASQMAMEILGEAFVNMRQNGDAEEVMKLGIEKANSAIFQMSHDLPQLSTMATTVVALHLQGNIATVGHVGDSRLYRIDNYGNLYRETQDHSIVEEEVRAGRMTAAQAVHHPSRNVISRALGAESTVEIDLKTIMFEPQTAFLLCSDGITLHVEDVEIRDLLKSGAEPDEICRQLKNLCYERGAEDNLTAVIVKIPHQIGAQIDEAADFEEPTVVRPSFAEVSPGVIDADEDAPTKDLQLPENFQAPQNFIPPPEAQPEIVRQTSDAANFEVLQPVASVENPPPPTAPDLIAEKPPTEIVTDEKTYRIGEKTDSGFLSRLLSSILLLISGAIIGVGAYYFWLASNVQPPVAQPAPQITQMQTPDIKFSAFEENRRNVDRSPETFIAANAAKPQDAEDFFLLGRAYLLTGKYAEAKQAFTESRNRLAQAKDVNSKTLANEIAISMAIINDPFAQKSLEKDVLTNKTESNSAVTPTNVNAAGNTTTNSNQ